MVYNREDDERSVPMKLKKELNPIFETIGLCCYIKYIDEIKTETVNALDHVGVDGQLFYNINYPLVNQYAEDFAARYVPHEDEDVLFGSMDLDMETTYIVLASIIENPHWIDHINQISEEKILESFSEMFIDEVNGDGTAPDLTTLDKRISFLNSHPELSDSSKWRTMLLLNDPKRYTRSMIEIYKQNLPAFQYAVSKNQAAIDNLMDDLVREGFQHVVFDQLIGKFPEIQTIFPSMISPIVEWGLSTMGFYGVLVNKAYGFGSLQAQERSALLASLKMLSDKSRFEILSLLKKGPKYNLEIAEDLQLSTPTASHHMNLLMTNGFVTIEKKDAKVYYHFIPEKIRELIHLLEKQFLI